MSSSSPLIMITLPISPLAPRRRLVYSASKRQRQRRTRMQSPLRHKPPPPLPRPLLSMCGAASCASDKCGAGSSRSSGSSSCDGCAGTRAQCRRQRERSCVVSDIRSTTAASGRAAPAADCTVLQILTWPEARTAGLSRTFFHITCAELRAVWLFTTNCPHQLQSQFAPLVSGRDKALTKVSLYK